MRIKCLIVSDNPNMDTGMGTVHRNIGLGLHANGYEVISLGWCPHDIPNKTPWMVYGTASKENYYGEKSFDQLICKERPHIVLTIGDPWTFNHIVDCQTRKHFLWVGYSAIDGEAHNGGIPPTWHRIFQDMDRIVAYTQYGKNAILKSLPEEIQRIDVIPHSIDPTIFYQMPSPERLAIRQQLGISEDTIIYLLVARNQFRKNIPEVFKAWAEFRKDSKHSKALLWPHMLFSDPCGNNLNELIQICNVNNALAFFKEFAYATNNLNTMPQKSMNELYNIADVCILACYLPETGIITNDGITKIKNIETGDKVLSIDGDINNVEKKYCYNYKGEIIEIETQYNNTSVRLTPNHRLFMLPKPNNQYIKRKLKREKPNLQIVQASELKVGDILVAPRLKVISDVNFINFYKESFIANQYGKCKKEHPNLVKINNVVVDKDLMYLFGLYIAKGCISQRDGRPDGVIFCVNVKEDKLTHKIIDIMFKKFKVSGNIVDGTRNRRKIVFYSVLVGEKFKELFGSGAHLKHMPSWFIALPHPKQYALVSGMWNSDGWVGFNKMRTDNVVNGYKPVCCEYTTVSEMLAWQLRTILIRLGFICSISSRKRESVVYRVRLCGNQGFLGIHSGNNKQFVGWIDNDFFYFPIKRINKQYYDGEVYDMQVKNNHSYTTTLCTGKNSGEGFGLPLIEAMATGKPLIALNHSACGELVGDIGELVKVKYFITGVHNTERPYPDIEDLVSKMDKLYYDSDLREEYGKRGLEKVKQFYSSVVNTQWSKYLRGVVNCFESTHILDEIT